VGRLVLKDAVRGEEELGELVHDKACKVLREEAAEMNPHCDERDLETILQVRECVDKGGRGTRLCYHG
jgi:hypothetical protein